MSEFHHVSVLLEECIEGLAIKPDGIYVDGTLGGAGHSSRHCREAHHRAAHRHRPGQRGAGSGGGTVEAL